MGRRAVAIQADVSVVKDAQALISKSVEVLGRRKRDPTGPASPRIFRPFQLALAHSEVLWYSHRC
jgi:hypothetical protein